MNQERYSFDISQVILCDKTFQTIIFDLVTLNFNHIH